MFKRLSIALLLGLAASIFILPVQAAGTWTAWLYEAQTGRMTEVNSGGNVIKQFQLPNEGGGQYSQHIAMSADNKYLAYTLLNASANSVKIYNMATNAIVYTFDAPATAATSFEFQVGPQNFSPDDSIFAFGYGGLQVPWKVLVIDINKFTGISLKKEDPISSIFTDPGDSFVPVVTSNHDKQVSFMMIPYGMDGLAVYKAFTWNWDANSIAPNNNYTTPDNATFAATNEIVEGISDDRFPGSHAPDTNFPVNNTLQVYDPKVNQRFVLTSFAGIAFPQFVQAGERVAVNHDYNQSDGTQVQSIVLVDRSGFVSDIVANVPQGNISHAWGTQDGFVFSSISGADPKSYVTNMYYVETRQANGKYNAVPVWSGAPGMNAELVSVADDTPTTTTTFPAWRQMAASAVTPTAASVGDGTGMVNGTSVGDNAYQVGVTVEVQTTNNDVLNLRSGPGVTFQRLSLIPNGTMLTLLEGPQNADGFVWWRVRLPNGSEGWVVAYADGVNTLLPR